MQHMPVTENTDSNNESFSLQLTKYNGRRKVCVKYEIDTDELNFVVYRKQNNMSLKNSEMELKMTEYKELFSERVYFLNYLDIFLKRCIVLDETTVHEQIKSGQEWLFSFL